jgi:hypothetical protein
MPLVEELVAQVLMAVMVLRPPAETAAQEALVVQAAQAQVLFMREVLPDIIILPGRLATHMPKALLLLQPAQAHPAHPAETAAQVA